MLWLPSLGSSQDLIPLDRSQWLLTAGIPRQAHFWKTQDSSEECLWLEVSLWVLPTSLEQCCGLRCSLSHSHGAAMSWRPVSSVSCSSPFSLSSICPLQLQSGLSFFFFFNIYLYLFIWLYWVLAATRRILVYMQILSCGVWDLVLWPGIEPQSPALGAESSLDHHGNPRLSFASWMTWIDTSRTKTNIWDWSTNQAEGKKDDNLVYSWGPGRPWCKVHAC